MYKKIVWLILLLKQQIEPEFLEPIEKGRLLIITPFEEKVKRVTTETATVRNQMMIELADKIMLGFASEGGALVELLTNSSLKKEINRI